MSTMNPERSLRKLDAGRSLRGLAIIGACLTFWVAIALLCYRYL